MKQSELKLEVINNHVQQRENIAQNAQDDLGFEIEKFCLAFKEKRKAKGVGLRDAAKAIGISSAFLSDCELGRRCPNRKMRERFISFINSL